MARVAVLGGGISGLTAAYYLARAANTGISKIMLIESGASVGGWIQTSQFDDGSVFEHGPRSLRGVGIPGANALLLAEELGLEKDILPIPQNHPATRNRFLYVNGQLSPLPNGLMSMLKIQAPFTKPMALMGMMEPFRKRKIVDDESVDSFIRRRFGDEMAKYAAASLCRGIYSGDSTKLSMKSTLSMFFNWEQKYGSMVIGSLLAPNKKLESQSALVKRYQREKWAMWSLRDGLQTLPVALLDRLQNELGVEVLTQSPCTGMDFNDDKIQLTLGKETCEVDHIICALPARSLAPLLKPQHPSLATSLGQISYADVGVVNLQYDKLSLPVKGFGHLVPPSEPSKVIGVLYDSCIFPQHDSPQRPHKLTCMMGGAWFREHFGDPDKCELSTLTETAIAECRNQLGVTQEPYRVIPSLQRDCIPQYLVGHSRILDAIDTYLATSNLPLSLVGASYRGVSVLDCIHNSKLQVDRLLDKISY